jgi:hypothetical protein
MDGTAGVTEDGRRRQATGVAVLAANGTICYVPASMTRTARGLWSILPALLLVLETTPSAAAMGTHTGPHGTALVSASASAESATLPLAGTVPDEPPGCEVAWARVPLASRGTCVWCTDRSLAVPGSSERAWLQVHRRRAPSPDDPDPF